MNAEKLAKLQASVRIGGKGTPRRKKKAAQKVAGGDDKKIGGALKKLGVQPIQGIEEINMFRKDGKVLHFGKPKVQAAVSSNTFVISGSVETKDLTAMMPDILPQLGRDYLQSFANALSSGQLNELLKNAKGGESAEGDEDIPELVGADNFEEASKKEEAATA
eukprot:Unigene1522_Nuclearia_a/m.4741 Unigene1522_Nuclearia_a/g.4741  ORF Unigene1522_Nuclearia_a/g.4741 Unigene1522_Nuclearia_a/m.4741 type:complete len:163 (+) Unigene1522_Nuclearia_a:274-762(+)